MRGRREWGAGFRPVWVVGPALALCLLGLGRLVDGEGDHRIALAQPPDSGVVRLAALGEARLAQTVLALSLQNAGEALGDTPSLRRFDPVRVEGWLRLVDGLDPRSDLAPALAAWHFAAAARPGEARRLARVLGDMGRVDPGRRWPWIVHAVYLAGIRGGDRVLAQHLARPLAHLPASSLPPWARSLGRSIPISWHEGEIHE